LLLKSVSILKQIATDISSNDISSNFYFQANYSN
jgi:hypothetical protein